MSNKEINNLICGFDIKRAHISQIEQSSIPQISLCKFDLSRYETTSYNLGHCMSQPLQWSIVLLVPKGGQVP